MKKLIPKIIVYKKELPQWITSSDIAAYHPYSKTIYLRKDRGLKILKDFIHELFHHFIYILNLNKELHKKLDRKNL